MNTVQGPWTRVYCVGLPNFRPIRHSSSVGYRPSTSVRAEDVVRVYCTVVTSSDLNWTDRRHFMSSAVLFLSRPWSEGWPYHGHTFSIYLYPLSFWLTLPQRLLSCPRLDVVYIQAVRGLPRLRTPGVVPCIISFSRQFPCFLMVWPCAVHTKQICMPPTCQGRCLSVRLSQASVLSRWLNASSTMQRRMIDMRLYFSNANGLVEVQSFTPNPSVS